ncbi:Spindle pole body component SPC42 [Nakaseomyces bracarensis]|uniref:Spindle pole body component SPC42 n=1 Tax=Nakaseomyces bracarensis TaxID=273131 RepID=A0ABR4NQU2_9SACH
MSISPTPRRYNSRSDRYYSSKVNDIPPFDLADNYNNKYTRYPIPNNLGDENVDRLIPEEIKLQKKAINDLISQNKKLQATTAAQRDEIERLNIIIGQFRAKLTKYSVLNKKLQEEINGKKNTIRYSPPGTAAKESSFESSFENANDYIQIPKKREEDIYMDEKFNPSTKQLNDKVDKLMELLANVQKQQQQQQSGFTDSSPRTEQNTLPVTSSPKIRDPSEEDIICQESAELKNLENQIEVVKKKLLIKKENELRKLSLENELIELMGQLSADSSPYHNNTKRRVDRRYEESGVSDSIKRDDKYTKEKIKPFNPVTDHNILETPTPNRRDSD